MIINTKLIMMSLLVSATLAYDVTRNNLAKADGNILVPPIDFKSASPAFSIDLQKLPQSRAQLVSGLAPNVATIVRDALNNRAISKAVDHLLGQIMRELPVASGMLLRIRVLTDELGHNSLPIDFLLPIGAGINPAEAYAEFINRPSITAPTLLEAGFIDASYYIWIEKGTSDLALVSNIPHELTARLLREGQHLAAEKIRLRAMGNPVQTFMVPDYVARADYWSRLFQERRERFETQERARAVLALTQRFSALQLENSRLLSLYVERRRQLSEKKALVGSAERILDLAEILSKAGSQQPALSFDYADAKKATDLLKSEVDELDRMQRENMKNLKLADEMLVRTPELM